MKVTAYRIAENGYDAMVMGFSRPCVISLYKRNVSPLCGNSDNNDEKVFRYASHPEQQPKGAAPMTPDFIYHDGLRVNDYYEYFSTICLDHLTHEQHQAMYSAVAEINDVTDRSRWELEDCDLTDEQREFALGEIKRTDVIIVNLKKCHLKFTDGTKADYDDLHR